MVADNSNNKGNSDKSPENSGNSNKPKDTAAFATSNEEIDPIRVDEEVKNSFLDYSMSVIISRALPDARDGLKPSQRRLLFAMQNDLSLNPSKAHLKCARIVGETMGKYHPHGDGAIYPTLVNMAQPWSMRDTLVEGQGNFGSVEGDPPAAMRYTEARLTHLGVALMSDMDKDTVDFVTNYDETRQEPSVLPAAFPNLLVNGGTGIAVGMATNIPPHNLQEMIDGIVAQIENPNITIDELMQFIQGPDFPTGCTILGNRGIRDYFHTGRGSVRVRGKAEIVEHKNHEQIIITEIPYNVNRAVLVERIAELVNTKVIPDISAIRDESDENTRVVIDLKRDARSQVVLNNLYKHTALESSFSTNMLAIDNRRPRLLNLKDAINCYIEHRREVILRRTRHLLSKAEQEAEKLEAFLCAIGDLDDVIKIVRGSMTREEAFNKLKAKTFSHKEAQSYGISLYGQPSDDGKNYKLTDNQVNHILELRLYQLVGLEHDKIKAQYEGVLEQITDYQDIIANESRVLGIIKEELAEIREKYGTERRTRIEPWEGDMDVVDLIANESNVITLSKRGFMKRTPASEFRTQSRGGKGLKGMETREAEDEAEEGDYVDQVFSAAAHDYLMFFTNTGRVYVERVYSIPEMGRTAKGRSIKNLLNLKPEESIAAVLRLEGTKDEEGKDTTFQNPDLHVFFATRSGKVKKTNLEQFKNYRKDGIIAIRLEEGNELVNVRLTNGEQDVMFISRNGLSVRTKEDNVRSMGRPSAGVRGINVQGDDELVALVVVEDPEGTILVVSEKGMGKRTAFSEYGSKGRGGKGMIAMKCNEKTGKLCGATIVSDEDEIMLMTTSGQNVRIPASDIRVIGRATSGVRLMSLKDGESIQDFARMVAGDGPEEEETEGEESSQEGTEPIASKETAAVSEASALSAVTENTDSKTSAAKASSSKSKESKAPASSSKTSSSNRDAIEEIEGIGEVYGAKLKDLDIHTTEEFIAATDTPAKRKKVAKEVGVSDKEILDWNNMAELMRLDGVGGEYAELLEAAGVDTVKELATRNAENLAEKMDEVNAEKKLTRRVPSAETLEKWIAEAQSLSGKAPSTKKKTASKKKTVAKKAAKKKGK